MSEIEPNKLKVVELRAELSTRGLDTKGNKAVLIQRLRTALNAERGDNDDEDEENAVTGNESVMDTSQDSQGDGNDTEPEEKQVDTTKIETKVIKADTPTKPDAKPVKADTPTKADAKVIKAETPTKADAKVTKVETPVKVAAKTADTPTKSDSKVIKAETPTKSPAASKTSSPGSSASKAKMAGTPGKEKEKAAAKEKEKEKESVEPMEVDQVNVASKDAEEKTDDVQKEKKEDDEKAGDEDAVKREPEECTEDDDQKEKDMAVLANGDAAVEGQAGVSNPDKDESEESGAVKKEPEVPEMVGQPITTMTSSSYGDRRRRSRSQSPFRRRRSHSRERRRSRSKSPQRAAVVEEEDDTFDMTLVTLDYYNSDLNLVVSKSRYGGSPLTDEGFAYMWAGARATYGFTKGKVHFEIKVIKHLDVNLPKDEPNPQVVRVGWSTDDTSLQLGEEAFSYGYGGTGKKSTDCQFTDYGSEFAEGDCIGCFLNLENDPIEMIYTKNGESLGVAFSVKKEDIGEKALFPHILTKNCSFEVNFGQLEEPFNQLGDDFKDYVFAHNVPVEDRTRGSMPPAKREDCEMVMMCGLPGAGKSTWAAEFVAKNPEKKYNVLGTNNIIDRMRLMGLPRKRNYSGRWDVLIERSTKCLNKMMEMGAKRRRNYILDQTNVYASAQRRKMRPFDGFKRRAVVVVPSDEELKKRVAKREKEEGKDVPDSAVLEMKANFILPEVGPLFESVEYSELTEEESKPLIEQYNREGRAAFPPSAKRPRFDDRSSFHGSPRVVSSRDRDRDRDRGWNDRRSMGPRSGYGGGGPGWGSGMSMRGSGSRGQQSYRGSSGRGGMGHSSMRSGGGGGGGYMNRSGGGGGYGGGGSQYHNQGGWGGSGYHHQPQHHQHHGHHQPQHHKPYQSRPNSQYQKPQSMSTSHSGYGQNYDYYSQQPSYSQQSYNQQWKPSGNFQHEPARQTHPSMGSFHPRSYFFSNPRRK